MNGSGNGARSGAQTLLLLAAPLNALILEALAGGAKQQADLRRGTGLPAQTSLRAQLKKLVDLGILEKHRRNRFPGVLEYELTASGRDLLPVIDVLERWLRNAPGGALSLDSNPAKAAVKALSSGWSTAMIRALAAGPLSLTELDGVIRGFSYPALERRLSALRLAGLVEASPGNGRGTPYRVTSWLREGLAPLAVAARWERRHAQLETAPIGPLDIEAAFLLALPPLRLPDRYQGRCRLAVEIGHGAKRRLAGVGFQVEGGAIEACSTNLEGNFDAWALGSPAAWLDAVADGRLDALELGGDTSAVRALVDALHEALFGTDVVPALDSDRLIEEDRSN